MTSHRISQHLAGALAALVAVTALLASSLATPSGPDVIVADTPLQDDPTIEAGLDDVDAVASGRALVTFEDSSTVPAEIIAVEAGDDRANPTGSISSGDLGVGDTITLMRPAGRRDIDIVVADGLVFTGFATTVLVPAAVHEVQLDMAIDGASVFSATVAGGSTEALTFSLDQPIVTDAVLSITVEERYGVTCTSTAVEPSALRLAENTFFFERLDLRPQTIADFFPPALHDVTLVTDPDAPSSVRSASFELATALARRYPQMPNVDVVHRTVATGPFAPWADAGVPVSDDPFSRTIVLTASDEAEMTVRQGAAGAYLEIAGPVGLLEEMAAAVSSAELAFITKASVKVEDLASLRPSTDLLAQRSLSDVGVRRLQASGSRVLELPIALPQSAFGEPVNEIRVRVGGLVVASSTNGRRPLLTLWLNGELQDAISYDDSGRFDLEYVIGPSQIERDNVLVLRSELPLECGDELPNHELTLDAGSWVDASPGQSLPPSLDRFPQVAVGHLSVASGGSENEIEVAMAMVGVLQGASPLPIRPQAAPVERVLAGFSPGLVVTDGRGDVAAAMTRDLTTVRSDQLAFVSSDRPEDLAFLSTSVTEASQDVLVVFSPTEDLSSTFVDVAIERGWSAFTGNAVGVRSDGDVVRSETSSAAEAEAALATLQDPPDEPMPIARQMGMGALAALLFVTVVVMLRFVLGALRRLR